MDEGLGTAWWEEHRGEAGGGAPGDREQRGTGRAAPEERGDGQKRGEQDQPLRPADLKDILAADPTDGANGDREGGRGDP
jgi:hypothetical protein